jgi:peptide/nickel transport system substrate-binding protein
MVYQNIMNDLVWVDLRNNNKIMPNLATEWEQKDELTWVFKLREGVQWHKDYGEFTAEDVEWNVNDTLENNRPRKFLYFFVKGAKAIDKYTVEYYLEQPFAPFLVSPVQGTGGYMCCKKAFMEMGDEEYGRSPIGTGAFEFKEWLSGDHITLVKNQNYWVPDRPFLEELTYRPITDAFVKTTALKQGEIDFIDLPDYKDVADLQADPNLQVDILPGNNWDYIAFNLFRDDLPTSIKEVRQAIGYAVDRQAIVDAVYYGYATADDDPLPPGFLAADPDQEKYPNTPDLEKAKQLLAEAGYPDGFEITAMTSDKTNLRRQLQLVADQLRQVGITVNIQNVDLGTYNATVRDDEAQWEMGLEDIDIMTGDPDSSLYWFHYPGTTLYFGWQNPDVPEMLDQGRIEQDPEKRIEIYRGIVDALHEDAPYLYTVHRNHVFAYNNNLKGYVAWPNNERNFNVQDVYWEA